MEGASASDMTQLPNPPDAEPKDTSTYLKAQPGLGAPTRTISKKWRARANPM
jgi:hypothetical protein